MLSWGKEGKVSGLPHPQHHHFKPLIGTAETEASGYLPQDSCTYSSELPFLSHQGLGAWVPPKGKIGFSILGELGWEMNSQHSERQPVKQPQELRRKVQFASQDKIRGSGQGAEYRQPYEVSVPTLIMSIIKCQDDLLLPWTQWTLVSELICDRVTGWEVPCSNIPPEALMRYDCPTAVPITLLPSACQTRLTPGLGLGT